ncbi:hypothetical protein Ancab_003884, partial [Ancistrocladus abbreviatus]
LMEELTIPGLEEIEGGFQNSPIPQSSSPSFVEDSLLGRSVTQTGQMRGDPNFEFQSDNNFPPLGSRQEEPIGNISLLSSSKVIELDGVINCSIDGNERARLHELVV